MTNRERIFATVRAHPGLTDSEIRQRTGISPHQQVNQICRRLATEGLVRRDIGPLGSIVNVPIGPGEPDRPDSGTRARPTPAEPRRAIPAVVEPQLDPGPAVTPDPRRDLVQIPELQESLLVVPCSGGKRTGGSATAQGPSTLEVLPSDLGIALRNARNRLAASARLDESLLLPAWRRYTGHFYQASAASLADAAAGDVPMIIISGGYGVVLANEPIGMYGQRFSLSDWPSGLLERCLLALAEHFGVTQVVSFCARTTGYSKLLRRVSWGTGGIDAIAISPYLEHPGGAQVFVPRASGEAFSAFSQGRLPAGWRSSDGVPIRTERL